MYDALREDEDERRARKKKQAMTTNDDKARKAAEECALSIGFLTSEIGLDLEEAFLAGVAWARANPEWVACSERMPEHWTEALWYSPVAEMRIDYIEGESNNPQFHRLDRKVLSTSYTHWCALPPAPEVDSK
jgi:hypothetical protein